MHGDAGGLDGDLAVGPREGLHSLPTLTGRFFFSLFLSMETNNLWLLSLGQDYTATWLVYSLLSSVDWSCVALSLFQEMHGHSCLKENPNDCIVFSAEWQLATSLLLLTDYSVASLLCATHHAVTNIIQQKKSPSKVTMFSSSNGSGRGFIHPILFSFRISPTSKDRKRGRSTPGSSRPWCDT